LTIVKTVGKKELYIKLVSPDIVNATTASVVRPGKMFVVKMGSNIIHVGVVKEVNKFIFGRRAISMILCIEIAKDYRVKVELGSLLNPVDYCVLSLVTNSYVSR
jgi:hypothetical protein